MIVITGPGRSGTSLIGEIYERLGFNPGGSWSDDNNAGREAPEVVEENKLLLRLLGITAYGPPVQSEAAGRSNQAGAS